MIGIDQEPSSETLSALNHALGEGKYRISYQQDQIGVKAIITTYEQPPREVSTQFPPNISREQIDATWQEFVSRASATLGQTELARSGPAKGALDQALSDVPSHAHGKPVNAVPAEAPGTPARVEAPIDERAASDVTSRDPVETDRELEGPHK